MIKHKLTLKWPETKSRVQGRNDLFLCVVVGKKKFKKIADVC